MAEQIPLTRAGYDQKQARLHYLRTERRQQVAEYLQEAQKTSELNDISLFEDARLLQAQVEAEIAELEHVLERAVIVEPGEQTRGRRGANGKRTVAVGTTVLRASRRYPISHQWAAHCSGMGKARRWRCRRQAVHSPTPLSRSCRQSSCLPSAAERCVVGRAGLEPARESPPRGF